MKNNCNIFIGGGFTDSQILWISKIISGYEKKPKKIVLEQKYNVITMNDFKKTFPDSEICIENETHKNFFDKFFFIILNLKKLFYFLFKLKKKKSFINSFQSQVVNSIWDTALNSMNDSQLKPTIYQKIVAILKSLGAIKKAKKILNLYDVKLVFLGHSVYGARAMLTYFRKKKIKIFCQAGFNVHDCSQRESAWNQISLPLFNEMEKKIKKKYIFSYWKKRLLGRANYFDAQVASNIQNKIAKYPKNVIFLHIFKDSPFNYLDEKRIFYDYFDWITKTLKILRSSKEMWALRTHPNASRWGEDQKKIIENLLINEPDIKKKIFIDENSVSNNFVFKNVNRLVTYAGTSHLEASCFGIKPIMISKSSLECIDKNFVLKPRNFYQYKNYLLKKSSDKIFIQSDTAVKKSKIYLFIRENILTLDKDINSFHTYRKDKKKTLQNDFNSVLRSLKSNHNYLESLGKSLRLNKSHTLSKKYYTFIHDKYNSK